jgi:hypothetical protein
MKLADPDNAMVTKRKISDASTPNASRRLRQFSPEALEYEGDVAIEPGTTEPNLSDSTDTEDDDPADAVEVYEEVKALGDADRKVCVHCLFQFIS